MRNIEYENRDIYCDFCLFSYSVFRSEQRILVKPIEIHKTIQTEENEEKKSKLF